MKAIVTVGLGFGDEGKGATVDFLTRRYRAEVVVRYCGGSQAGHNVELPDGSRHTFSQFGAGTLAGAKTYLGPRMIISPATLPPEAEHLKRLGVENPYALLTVHPDCLVSTFYHITMNRLRELSRGEDRHGSCGLGIGETRHYWLRYGQDAVFANDLRDPRTLRAKLALLRDRVLLEMQELPTLDEESSRAIHETRPAEEAGSLQSAFQGATLSPRLPEAQTLVFEGAQGVLLDEWKGFPPYTTWSTVTTHHAWELIAEHQIEEVTVLGLTRAYATRHGSGPFPTFDPELTARTLDPGNPENPWQGRLRCGALDLVLLNYAISACPIDGLVVNNLDQVPKAIPVCRRYARASSFPVPKSLKEQSELTERLLSAQPEIEPRSPSELLEDLKQFAPVVLTADGPTHQHREIRTDQTILPADPQPLC